MKKKCFVVVLALLLCVCNIPVGCFAAEIGFPGFEFDPMNASKYKSYTAWSVCNGDDSEDVLAYDATKGEAYVILPIGTEGYFKIAGKREDFVFSGMDNSVIEVKTTGEYCVKGYGETTVMAFSKDGKSFNSCTVRAGFSDVKSGYYTKYVNYALVNGITNGYKDGSFGVGKECTRIGYITMLWRMYGTSVKAETESFSDMSGYATETDSYKAVAWAKEVGITKGYSDGTFRPKEMITRKDAIIMLYRAIGYNVISPAVSVSFSDIKNPNNSDTYKAIRWGEACGVINGYSDGTFRPDNACTREQAITILCKGLNTFIYLD